MRSRRIGSLYLLPSLRSGGRLRRHVECCLVGLSLGQTAARREHVRVQPEEPTRCGRDGLALCFSCKIRRRQKRMATKSIRVILPTILVTILACSPRSLASNENCASVSFDVITDMVGPSGRGTATVSIQAEDVSIANLACVATRLAETHPSWGDVDVQIFDSPEAAKNFVSNRIGHSESHVLDHLGRSEILPELLEAVVGTEQRAEHR